MTTTSEQMLALKLEPGEIRDGRTGELIAFFDDQARVWRATDGTETYGLAVPTLRVTPAVSEPARAARNQKHDAAWLAAAKEQVRELARSERELTTDDVWRVLTMPPRESRQLGGLMKACRADGMIELTDRHRATTRPNANRRPVRIWESLIYDPLAPPPSSPALF